MYCCLSQARLVRILLESGVSGRATSKKRQDTPKNRWSINYAVEFR